MSNLSEVHNFVRRKDNHIDDATLCERIVEDRDTEAFAIYMERHRAKFLRFLQHKCSFLRDPYAAEDFLSDVTLNMLKIMANSKKKFCGYPQYFNTWFHSCLLRACLRYVLLQKRQGIQLSFNSVRDWVDLSDGDPDKGFQPDPFDTLPLTGYSHDPADVVMFDENARRLVEVWEKYVADHKNDPAFMCLSLQAEGLEYQEIAGRLRIPTGTVKSRIFRAKGGILKALVLDNGGYLGGIYDILALCLDISISIDKYDLPQRIDRSVAAAPC